MKLVTTLFLLCTVFVSLSGQSTILKVGATYRNTNRIHGFGFHLGSNLQVSERLTLAANIGHISSSFDYEDKDLYFYEDELLYQENETSTYVEVMPLVPLLSRWIPSGNLKGGIKYVGSQHTLKYLEQALIIVDNIELIDTKYLKYFLHELGVILEYVQPISDHFVIFASTGFSRSLNTTPGRKTAITKYYTIALNSSVGTSSELSATKSTHLRLSFGIGYKF